MAVALGIMAAAGASLFWRARGHDRPDRASDDSADGSAELSPATVLAEIPVEPRRDNTLTILEAMDRTGTLDAHGAARLASIYIQRGTETDDNRFFGLADAMLARHETKEVGKIARPPEFFRAKARVKSLLHDFAGAREVLGKLVATTPGADDIRRELFFLELLQGEITSAERHCQSAGGFRDQEARTLCSANIILARGMRPPRDVMAQISALAKSGNPAFAGWADDLLLEQAFIDSTKASTPRANQKPSKPLLDLAVVARDSRMIDKPRMSYLADRLIAAGEPQAALELIPATTGNFALAVRWLVANSLAANPAASKGGSGDAGRLTALCRDTLRIEEERGAVDHHREAALMALFVDGDVERARGHAESNWKIQREWIDAWLLVRTGADPSILAKWSQKEGGVKIHGA